MNHSSPSIEAVVTGYAFTGKHTGDHRCTKESPAMLRHSCRCAIRPGTEGQGRASGSQAKFGLHPAERRVAEGIGTLPTLAMSIKKPNPDEESLAVARYPRLLSDHIKAGLTEDYSRALESLRGTFVIRFRERLLGIPVVRSLASVLASIGKRIV